MLQCYRFIFLLCFNYLILNSAPYEVFVSPTGNDSNPGTGTAPFKTLYWARDKVTATKSVDGTIITLLGGTYKMDSAFYLTSKHVGSKNASFVIRGKDGDTAILTSAINLSFKMSKLCDNSDITAGIDPAFISKIKKWAFDDIGITDTGFWTIENLKIGKIPQLYCADSVMQLAQWPDTGYALTDSILETTPFITKNDKIKGDSICKIYVKNTEIKKWKKEVPHILMHGYWFWDYWDNFEIIANIDTNNCVLQAALPPNSTCGYRKGQRFRVLNLLCNVNREGKWAVDPARKFLYFWPPNKAKDEIIKLASNSNNLLRANNFSNLTVQNITLENVKADAISLFSCTTTTINNCIIKGITGNGISHYNSVNSKIVCCNIYNIGKSAIELQDWDNENLDSKSISIVNNIIHDFGRIEKTYAPAVLIGRRTVGCMVVYNTIYNAPHSAITFWGNNHNIENNYVFNVCTETQDAGVFYTGRDWTARGTVIKNNYIKDCGENNVNAIYIDDFAGGINVQGNVIDNVPFGIRIGEGSDNDIQKNTFVNLRTWLTITKRNLVDFYNTLSTRLNAVPLNDTLWMMTYPVLLTILKDNPECAKRNFIRNNIVVNSGKCNFLSEVDTFGIIDSGTFVPWYSTSQFRFGVQPVLDSSVFHTVPLRRMPLVPMVRNNYSQNGVLYVACVPSCHAGHVKSKIVNLRSRFAYRGTGGDTVAFAGLKAGDYVFSIWYSDITFQDSTFAAQDTVHFSADGSLIEKPIYTEPSNPCVLGGASVDSASIALFWKVNTIKDVVFDSIGLWYNEFGYLGKASDSGAIKAGIWDLKTTFDTIRGLKAEKLYYFSIFGRDTAGNWSKTSDSAKLQIRTGKYIGTTKGFPVIFQGSEAESLFIDTLVIRGDNLITPYSDTIDRWDVPFANGFLTCNTPFSFRNGAAFVNAPLHFAVKYHIPNISLSPSDIRLYRFNVNTMAWRMDTVKLTFDMVGSTLFFSTGDLKYPFLLMIDTIAPKVSAHASDTAKYTIADPINDTFTIRDNIENLRIKLMAGPGGKTLNDISFFITSTQKTGIYASTIPAYLADPASGLRAFLIVSDSRFTDTINLSRKIIRTGLNCDNKTVPAMEWTPVAVTANLLDNTLEKIFSVAFRVDTFSYDNREIRIMQWLPIDSNSITGNKWIEYSPGFSKDFSFIQGKTIWVKCKRKMTISFDTAIIPAMVDTFSLTLKKGIWNDFSLPYNFDIYTDDMFAATSKNGGLIDSIELDEWVKAGSTYDTRPLYLRGIEDASGPGTVLKAGKQYIAFNHNNNDITLRIPPVCTTLSLQGQKGGVVKKKVSSQQWSIRLGFRDDKGIEFSPVYCAALPENRQPRYYQAAPTFATVTARILDKKSGKKYAHTASGDLSSGGTSFTITCENQSDQPSVITAAIDKITGLPSQNNAVLYFKGEKFDTSLSNNYTMTIAAKQKNTGYLVVGTGDFISRFLKTINSVFSFKPFTFNNVLRIRYTLPINTKKMTTSIFDLKGRCLKRIIMTSGLIAGEGVLTLDSRFASGYYVVQMMIETVGSSKPGVLNRRWMLVR